MLDEAGQSTGQQDATLTVLARWKGAPLEELIVRTQDKTDCGFTFEIGAAYFVTADSTDGSLWTGECRHTDKADTDRAETHMMRAGEPLFVAEGVELPHFDVEVWRRRFDTGLDRRSLRTLTDIGPAATPLIPDLVELIRDDSVDTRLDALHAAFFVAPRDSQVVDAIVQWLRGSPDGEISRWIHQIRTRLNEERPALFRRGDTCMPTIGDRSLRLAQHLPGLEQMQSSESPGLRRAAINALDFADWHWVSVDDRGAELGLDRECRILAAALADSDRSIRVSAWRRATARRWAASCWDHETLAAIARRALDADADEVELMERSFRQAASKNGSLEEFFRSFRRQLETQDLIRRTPQIE